jgi:sulfide:quinone oxidoreductase
VAGAHRKIEFSVARTIFPRFWRGRGRFFPLAAKFGRWCLGFGAFPPYFQSVGSISHRDLQRRKARQMANIVELETGIFVASQLSEADFDLLPAMGFRSVVANRPDGEAEDQLPRAAAEAAARRNGLQFRYQPIASIDVNEDEPVEAFRALMDGLTGPTLFYCRTGTRSTLLWAQAAAGRLGVSRTITIAARAGFDLDPYRDILEERAAVGRSATRERRPVIEPAMAVLGAAI